MSVQLPPRQQPATTFFFLFFLQIGLAKSCKKIKMMWLALSCLLLLSQGQQSNQDLRQIKLGPKDAPVIMTSDSVSHLLQQRHKTSSQHGPGFVDMTHSGDLSRFQRQILANSRPRNYPERPSHQELVQPLLELATTRELEDFLVPLTEHHNRYYTSPTGVEASTFIRDWAQSIINTTRDTERYSVELVDNDFPQPNIVARIEGSTDAEDILILGAHMDSINSVGPIEDWEDARAPGADDDGSGSAAIMEVFRVMAESNYVPQRSVEFQWYAGEERGLLGSRNLAASYARQGRQVHAMLQIDMCGGGGPFKFINDYVSEDLTRFETTLVDEYCQNDWVIDICGYACSDHASWNETGYPSSFPIESAGTRDPVDGTACPGHTDNDRVECVDFNYVMDYTRLGLAFVVELGFL
eukprot:Lithocolla_globosa_v1_NODE_2180_length_2124_cov_26.964199.p1 type:complete len:411 gc:universal NODE_2180_length_2124_cov_26.964199:804-2036(+)